MSAKSAVKTRTAHYVLSTHWDREWYQSFQDYRERLVRLMDGVVAGLEDGRLRGPFTSDGQSIVLEDYLEIRPERRAAIERLAKAGRIAIGPWYVLPDEFLVSGEAMVRNLRMGRDDARAFGTEPSNAGFVCDLFGHISQLPQILRGFGIETAFVWRGINLDTKRHLVWEGADDSQLVVYKFANIGYCDYAFKVRDCHLNDRRFEHDRNLKQLHDYIEFEASETEIDAVLLFDGGDHQEWDEKAYRVLAETIDNGKEGFEVRHTTLDDYQKEMLSQRDRIATRFKGEMRESGKTPGKAAHQIHGVLSSRVWIKQQNQHCQNMLCHWAEPLSSFANIALGAEYPKGYLDLAWRWLIRNHPHDSICGCSIDQVHEDMKYRFSQARQIAELVTRETSYRVAASIQEPLGEKEVRTVVFNPSQEDFDGVATVELHLPTDWPKFGEFFGFEQMPVFTIHGPDGAEIPFQRVHTAPNRRANRIQYTKFSYMVVVDKVTVALPLNIPALGYAALTIRPARAQEPKRYSQVPSLVVGRHALDNGRIRVEAAENGSLTLTDKSTGEVYKGLLAFEDRADIGDGWFHGVAINDELQFSTASATEVAVVENGRYVAALRIRTTMQVPEEFAYETMVRSPKRVAMTIDTVVRLRAGGDHVEFETVVDNTAKDHRVRVLFPSGAKTDKWATDQAFDVVERDIPLRADNHECHELEVETKPQQSFACVCDGKRGLAVVSTGLMESAVSDQEDRPVALTLFRGTRKTVNTDGEPEGQILGELRFKYAVKPLSGKVDRKRLFLLGQEVANGLRAVNMQPVDIELNQQLPHGLPPKAGFLSVGGGAVMTSCRTVDGAVELRVFNPEDRAIDAVVDWSANPKAMDEFVTAQSVDLESKPLGEPRKLLGRSFRFALAPKRIATWRFGR